MRYWVAALLLLALIGLAGRCHGAIFNPATEGAIVVMGAIEEGDYKNFVAAVETQKKTEVVILNGPGGYMIEALAIGEYVRNHQIKTIAFGQCYSGCAYIWLAGHRKALLPNAEVGFHGAYDRDTKLADAGSNAVLGKYMSDCGMSVNFIISALAGGTDFRVFGPEKIDFMEKTFGVYIFPLESEEQINFFMETR